jgi:hypothetical protein
VSRDQEPDDEACMIGDEDEESLATSAGGAGVGGSEEDRVMKQELIILADSTGSGGKSRGALRRGAQSQIHHPQESEHGCGRGAESSFGFAAAKTAKKTKGSEQESNTSMLEAKMSLSPLPSPPPETKGSEQESATTAPAASGAWGGGGAGEAAGAGGVGGTLTDGSDRVEGDGGDGGTMHARAGGRGRPNHIGPERISAVQTQQSSVSDEHDSEGRLPPAGSAPASCKKGGQVDGGQGLSDPTTGRVFLRLVSHNLQLSHQQVEFDGDDISAEELEARIPPLINPPLPRGAQLKLSNQDGSGCNTSFLNGATVIVETVAPAGASCDRELGRGLDAPAPPEVRGVGGRNGGGGGGGSAAAQQEPEAPNGDGVLDNVEVGVRGEGRVHRVNGVLADQQPRQPHEHGNPVKFVRQGSSALRSESEGSAFSVPQPRRGMDGGGAGEGGGGGGGGERRGRMRSTTPPLPIINHSSTSTSAPVSLQETQRESKGGAARDTAAIGAREGTGDVAGKHRHVLAHAHALANALELAHGHARVLALAQGEEAGGERRSVILESQSVLLNAAGVTQQSANGGTGKAKSGGSAAGGWFVEQVREGGSGGASGDAGSGGAWSGGGGGDMGGEAGGGGGGGGDSGGGGGMQDAPILCDPAVAAQRDSNGGGVSANKLNLAAARAGQGEQDLNHVSSQTVAERLAANEAAYTAGQAIDDAVDILLESFDKRLGVSSEGEHFGEEVYTCMKQMCRRFDGIRSFKIDDHVMKFARSVRSSLRKCRMEKDEIEFTVQYVNEMWMKGGGQLKVCVHVCMRAVRMSVSICTYERALGHTHAHTHTHTHRFSMILAKKRPDFMRR